MANTRPPACLMAFKAADLELAACPRPQLVMAATPCRFVEPEARRPVKWTSLSPALPVIGQDFGHEIGVFAFECLPALLAIFIENPIEWRVRDDQTTDAAAITCFNHRQSARSGIHDI
jgi:hypothetical protein